MQVPLNEFQGFPKIARLSRDMLVSEKIDGTNAAVVVPDDPAAPLLAQSRNRFITPEDDNFGFAGWVWLHAKELRGLGPGRHFGEWFGCGINRAYGLTERRFALFNTSRWHPLVWEHFEDERCRHSGNKFVPRLFVPPPACCQVVPALYLGLFDTAVIEQQLRELAAGGSRAVEGFMRPEGIVIYHIRANVLFKKTIGPDGEKGEQ